MRLLRYLSDAPHSRLAAGSVVTIGSYDGLHLGHQQLLARVLTAASDRDMASVVMSFEPTPREFFGGRRPPARLMRFREKFDGLARYGVDFFYCPHFSPAMRGISAADFIRRVLVQGLNARHVVVGDDFHFARRREGSVADLHRVSDVLDIAVDELPSHIVEGIRVSSTAVRAALADGDVRRANRLLGRPYRMSGRVIRGERVGRGLGYPTANVDLRRRRSAVMGIYAVRVHGITDEALDGVASVGSRPTFDGTKAILEVHLFDFDADIYGRYIHVDFVEYIRGQEKFASVDDLVAQMHRDADNARSILAAKGRK